MNFMINDNDRKKYKIETENLILRLLEFNDIYSITEILSNINVTKNLLEVPYPYTLEDAKSFVIYNLENFYSERFIIYMIADRETNEIYGSISMSFSQIHNRGEVGYYIGEEYWGRGIMTEALKAVIDFWFDKGLKKIVGNHFEFNKASGKVMEKAGMKCEGSMKKHVKRNGKYYDLVYYGIINEKV